MSTDPLAKDTAARNNCRIERQLRPSTRYGMRHLPMATWPVPGEFYRNYIAAWIGPILEFARAHVRHITS
jgi:hypothetical protein